MCGLDLIIFLCCVGFFVACFCCCFWTGMTKHKIFLVWVLEGDWFCVLYQKCLWVQLITLLICFKICFTLGWIPMMSQRDFFCVSKDWIPGFFLRNLPTVESLKKHITATKYRHGKVKFSALPNYWYKMFVFMQELLWKVRRQCDKT